jgi:hypothetical protein
MIRAWAAQSRAAYLAAIAERDAEWLERREQEEQGEQLKRRFRARKGAARMKAWQRNCSCGCSPVP